MLIISSLKRAFKCIPMSAACMHQGTSFTAVPALDQQPTQEIQTKRPHVPSAVCRQCRHLQKSVTRTVRQSECPSHRCFARSSPTFPTPDPDCRPSRPRSKVDQCPPAALPLSLLLLLMTAVFLLTLESVAASGSPEMTLSQVRSSSSLPSLEPCFSEPGSTSGRKERPFGLPCLLSHSSDNYDRETTPEERQSTVHYPLAFLMGPNIRRGLRSIQGLEYLLHAFHVPSPIRLIGKIILRILSNSY